MLAGTYEPLGGSKLFKDTANWAFVEVSQNNPFCNKVEAFFKPWERSPLPQPSIGHLHTVIL